MTTSKFTQSVGYTLRRFVPFTAMVALATLATRPATAQVIFQQFYYPIDAVPAGTSWWRQASGELPVLSRLGVYAIWSPVPVKGGSGSRSMGYDPYDLYDLGSKDQKGTIPTRFGTRDEYLAYIATAHANGLRFYADVVLNHTGGADYAIPNPLMEKLNMDDIPDDSKVPEKYRPAGYDPTTMNLRGWMRYLPKGADGKPGTGRFPRDWQHFHPSPAHPDRNEPYHKPEFGEDYCPESDNGYVGKNLCDWGAWFKAQTGIDGMRLDAVKLAEPPFLRDFAARVTTTSAPNGSPFFLVGEFWDTNHTLLSSFQTATENRMSLFDFGLFYGLWDMTEKPGTFDMRDLLKRRLPDRTRAVSFVSNHDVDRFQPINRQKRALPYAITMTMSGQPSLFYRDYFRPEDKTLPAALERLVTVHNRFAVGKENIRFADADVLVIEREGNLIGCFNDGGAMGTPRTVTFPTAFGKNARLKSVGQAEGTPDAEVVTDSKTGDATVTIPSGGYVLLTRADANLSTNPDRFARRPYATTQTWEFADDLDTGRLSNAPHTVTLTSDSGKAITATLTGLTGSGTVLIEALAPDGTTIAKATGKRRKPLTLRFTPPHAGNYRLQITAPGTLTTSTLTTTYTAPPSLP